MHEEFSGPGIATPRAPDGDASPQRPGFGTAQPWPEARRDPRSYEELVARLVGLAQSVASAPDLRTVYRALKDFIVASAPCSGLFVSLLDREHGERVCAYAWIDGGEEDVSKLPRLPPSGSPSSRAAASGEIVVTDDFQAAINGQPRIDLGLERDPRQPQSAISVPMHMLGRTIGVFEVQSVEPRAYTQEHVTAMRMAASIAAIAIQNVILLDSERTQRQAAEAAEENYRLLFRNNPRPMWVFELATLKFLAVNEAAVRHYGFTEEEFLAMDVRQLRPAGDVPGLLAAISSARGPQQNLAQHRKKTGEMIDVEVTSDAITFDGKPARIVLAADITERLRAERARDAAQEKLVEQAALLDSARDGIVVRDLDHLVQFWNKGAERLYGWSAAEAIGRRFDSLVRANPAQVMLAEQAVLATGEWNGELEKAGRNGALIVDGRWTLLRNGSGEPKSILSIDTDVTARRKLETQFLRAQRMESIGTLAGGIAHDLNNLLAPISMAVDLLQQDHLPPDSQQLLRIMEQSAKRSTDLVRQVLSFARGVEGARVAVQIRHVVRELAGIVENTFPKSIHFESNVPDDAWVVRGDPTQIQQVLLNLCVNARDAMPDGGRLRVRTHNLVVDERYCAANRGATPGRYLVIEVDDTGCGIAKDAVDKIFEPFFTTKELGKGSGLGLATSLGIVRSHNGFIEVNSATGQGAVFRIFLPAQAGEARVGAEPQREAIPRGKGELVLIVDDEPSILSVLKQTLEAFGYRVLMAENGAEAVGIVGRERENISLVITDMMMPLMDGPSAALAMRRIHPNLKVIGSSGLDTHDSVRATNAGIGRFLMKPFSVPALLTIVRETLES